MDGRCAFARIAPALFALALFAPPARAMGWSHDPTQNLPLLVAPRGQCVVGMVADTKGGAVMVWAEPCTTYTYPVTQYYPITIHAMHLLKRGDIDPAWPPTTTPLFSTSGFSPLVMPDSLGGLYLAWTDDRNVPVSGRDIFAQHLRNDGTLDPAWPAGGRPVCTAPGHQYLSQIASDGSGGILLAWNDRRDSASTGLDVYCGHVLANGTVDPAWPVNGRAVCTAASTQAPNCLVPDGSHGAVVVWTDYRNQATTYSDIYAGRVRANGTLDPAWPANGLAVSATSDVEQSPTAAPDDAGGAFVAWGNYYNPYSLVTHVQGGGTLDPGWPAGGLVLDATADYIYQVTLDSDDHGNVIAAYDVAKLTGSNEVYVRHVFGNGAFDPGWPAGGTRLDNAASGKALFGSVPPGVPDGHGGMIYTYFDDLDGTGNQYVISMQRVDSGGNIEPGWPPHGRPFSVPPSDPIDLFIVNDGDGGTIATWTDLRDSAATYYDVYAQRVTKDGYLGVAEATISSIRDVPNDQGGRVTLRWYATAYDTLPADPISEYDIWRELSSAPAAGAARVIRAGATPVQRRFQPGDIRVTRNGVQDVFWEFLASVPARGLIPYAYTVNTYADSTAASLARETFEIDIHGLGLNYILSSDPDSGYSVDNLAPATPSSFAGSYSAGTSALHWDRNLEPDFSTYRLYRGAGNFTPGPANLIATLTGLDYADNAGMPWEYKLAAVDLHGNVSGYAVAVPGGALDADAALPKELALAPPSPSPARASAAIRFALPRATPIRLAIYDVGGRRVRTIAQGPHAAGEFTLPWNLRDDGGRRAPPGLYVVTLEAEGRRFERRVALLR